MKYDNNKFLIFDCKSYKCFFLSFETRNHNKAFLNSFKKRAESNKTCEN